MNAPGGFDAGRPWQLHPEVALREESFGALAYHYGNRRLVFLRSRALVDLVAALERFPSATQAVEATVAPAKRDHYVRALERLAAAEVIGVR
jgi:putative mycofactocin binding protein MftB